METDGLTVNNAVIKSSALSVWVGLNVSDSDQSAGRRDSRSPVASLPTERKLQARVLMAGKPGCPDS